MVMEAKISSSADGHLHLENIPIQDSDSGIMSSTPDHVEPRQPEKRPTRQWAAWTRQEEESFFTALRHVGKNFEKITRRVQSKNKDQVRHYYYRLVRRMNKLLGPGLCLDAKNSKDTNAAMLRWWSLLEKYSCKASKLHLKPRRFKIFMDALENQLLKDRKKNVRKRSSQADNVSPTASSTTTNQNRALGHETRTVKLVLVESQNIQKIGAGRGSLKRNVCVGVIRGNSKGDSTANKPARQRRKQAAYKKWEKAAIAGVSLVADAAEHLERTTTDKEVEDDQVQTDLDPVDKVLAPVPASSLHCTESNVHNNTKLKLQLFPIDNSTRRALEVDKHNPHLELTLSTRKKISSVLEHLNRKWGNSSIACGELVLFPYIVQRENLASYQRWTQDSIVSAADVYNLTGSPPVFRLRYGWFPNLEVASATFQVASTSNCIPPGVPVNAENVNEEIQDSVSTYRLSTNDQCEKLVDLCADHLKNDPPVSPLRDASNAMSGFVALASKRSLVKSTDPAANISWHRKENTTNAKQLEDTNVTMLSTREWADSLTNISIGDLLSGVPHEANPTCIEPPFPQNTQCLDQLPFSCDSFDAAIAAHVSRHHNKMNFSSALTSSIWDAEETCDAFSFQRGHAFCHELPTSSHAASPTTGKQTIRRSPMASGAFLEDLPEVEEPVDYPAGGDPMDICPSEPQLVDNSPKDFNGLADIYWPESLGPLDLDIASSKYHNEDFILSDSLGGLSNLIASSLDAFQSCSFFALNKKDSTSKVEAPGSASFADFKIGSGV